MLFVRQVQFAEGASGYPLSEDIKVDVLSHHLEETTERYYNQQLEGLWKEQPDLEHAMQCLLHTIAPKVTPVQSMKIFAATKSPARSWTEHYLHLVAEGEVGELTVSSLITSCITLIR
uniref:Uncharacterized protein AlNc14C122G6719 n=1 Tax=Albugo laibachii Nc14 TaxID=890382 RepID=F0WJJ4_9STRA|nr:conserved hypothetical protein [Albugo laibachii Nc14]|eukprot:CCA21443.1 conserved hypothetical protein [Albugo laibachii Nc14]